MGPIGGTVRSKTSSLRSCPKRGEMAAPWLATCCRGRAPCYPTLVTARAMCLFEGGRAGERAGCCYPAVTWVAATAVAAGVGKALEFKPRPDDVIICTPFK